MLGMEADALLAAVAIAVLVGPDALLLLSYLWSCFVAWRQAPCADSYQPGIWGQLRDVASVARAIARPPELRLGKGDCVIVMDAIEAYRSMYDEKTLQNIARLTRLARASGAKVVFTRWVRFRPEEGEPRDATDRKGHWTDYIPRDQTEVMPELGQAPSDTVAFVRFTNAFTSETVRGLVEEQQTKRVILCGGWLEACLLTTAKAALERDIDAGVVREASVGHPLVGLYASFSMQMVCATMYKMPPVISRRIPRRDELRIGSWNAFLMPWGWPASVTIRDPVP